MDLRDTIWYKGGALTSSFKVYHGAQILMCIYIIYRGTLFFAPPALGRNLPYAYDPMAGTRFWGNNNEISTLYASWRSCASSTSTALRPG